tara:strand:- start:1131 stop:1652 length:522 start_codon:yes stop_codon:yes gene_type:complete
MNSIFSKILIIFFFLFCFFIFLKGLDKTDNYQPKGNIGKTISTFSAQKLFDSQVIYSDEFLKNKKFYLINIWSSWCVPCRTEHSKLMTLSKNSELKIIGLNYRDKNINALKFIKELGNPYHEILTDKDGTIAISLGAFGVPETFLLNNKKIIVKKYIGPLTDHSLKEINLILE